MVEEVRPISPSTAKKHLSHRSRQIFVQVVVGMIILICGVVIGWGAAVLNLKGKVILPPGPRPPTDEVVNDMKARYGLTEEQAKKIEAAFRKRRETIQTIFEEFRTKSEAEFQKLSTDIKKILTPEQYARWEQDFERRRRPGPPWDRSRGRPDQRGPGRGGPDDRGGPGGRFGDGRSGRGPGGRGPRRDFNNRDHEPWGPGVPGPNAPEPNSPEPNAPEPNAPSDMP